MHNNIIDPKRKPQFGFCSVLYNFHLSPSLAFSLSLSLSPLLLSLSLSQCLFYRVTTAYTVFDNFTDDPRQPRTPSRKIIEYYHVHACTQARAGSHLCIWRCRKNVNADVAECEIKICINTVTCI